MMIKFWILVIFTINLIGSLHCLTCYSCNSLFDENCPSKFNLTAKELCEEGEECVTFIDNNSTIYRACSSDMNDNIRDFRTCNTSDLCNNDSVCLENMNCIFCDDEKCQDEEQTLKYTCFECDSTINQDCRNFQLSQHEVICSKPLPNQIGCYHYEKGSVIKRGCLSNLAADSMMLKDCENGFDCKICLGNNCNSREYLQKCYTCNSFDNPSCATLKDDLPTKLCDDYFDNCKVYVKPNSTTHRGCSKEIDEVGIECSPQTVNCRQCHENLCNGGIFPSNRITCYQCKGFPSSDCSKNVTDDMIYPCQTYNFRDSCYLIVDKNNITSRGCMSDSDFFSNLCHSNAECDICQSSNCNTKSVTRPPTMYCIKCDTVTDPKCLWGFSESSKVPCTKNVMYFQEESCFVHKVSATTLIRGCTLDSNACKLSNSCNLCKESGCNNEMKIEQFCIDCSSEDDEKCFDEPQNLKNVSCVGNITYEQRGCYTWINELKHISRGCYSSLSATKKFKCMNDHEHCEICYQNNNCNILPKNTSHNLHLNNFYIIVSALILMLTHINHIQ